MIANKNKLVLLGVCVLLLAAGVYALWGLLAPGNYEEKVALEERPEDQAFESAIGNSSEPVVVRSASRYTDLYDKYAAGALANDPVSIEKFMMLTGACESGTQVMSGGKIPDEVKRLREFCAMHSSGKEEPASPMNDLWSQSYSAKLQERMRELEARAGSEAVRRELSAELRTSDPYQAQMALEYAANAGVIPEGLDLIVDKSDASLSKQLSILSRIEFCKRGGECGGADLAALSACVALPPCPTKLDLLEVIRRSSAPRDYEAALRMSQALHKQP